MKILFVSYKLCDGGAERVLAEIANKFINLGHTVTILLYTRNENEYPIDYAIKLIDISSSYIEQKNKFIRAYNRIRAIRKNIDIEKPDIVIPFLDSMVRESYLATIGKQAKLVATIRNSPYNTPGNAFSRKLRNYFCWKSDAIWVQNKDQQKYFSKRIQNKTFVVPNPIQDVFLSVEKKYSKKITRFVTCGRLHEQKNHKLLIDGFSKALENNADITLSIYGVGPLENTLKEYISKNNLDKYIFLMGRTNKVHEILQNYDAFILSSNFEGMPNALMEAMAVGLPCISTDCQTGPADLIENHSTGLLIPINNVDEMANAIIYFINNSNEANQMGIRAKKMIKSNYSETNIAYKILNALKKL